MASEKTRIDRMLLWGWLAAVSLGTVIWLASIPTDQKNAVLLGFSRQRLLLLLPPFFTFLLSILFFFITLTRGVRFAGLTGTIHQASPYCVGGFFLVSGVFFYFWYWNPTAIAPYAARILPLIVWLLLLLGGLILFGNAQFSARAPKTKISYVFVLFFLIQLLAYWVVRKTGIGVTVDSIDWQPAGMAVGFWQIGMSLWAGLLVVALFHQRKKSLGRGAAIFLFLLIWGLTAWLWIRVPTVETLKSSYFMTVTPPNNMPYPVSDAAYFDLWAETILAGLGFKQSVVSRQLFVIFLAGLHGLSRGNFLMTIDLLTAALALIPPLFFLLGKRLDSIGVGVMLAGIAMFRELNTLWITPVFGVSNAKMFLSDLPMLLCLLIYLNAALRWLQQTDKKSWRWDAFFAGGWLGVCALIRSQSLVLLIITLGFLFSFRRFELRLRFQSAALFLIGLLLVMGPAMGRSLTVNGTIMLEDTNIHGYELARRVVGDADFNPARVIGESEGTYAARMEMAMRDAVRSRPDKIAFFVANHFVKQQIDAWFTLPAGLRWDSFPNGAPDSAYQAIEQRMANPANWAWALVIAIGMASLARNQGRIGFFAWACASFYMLSTATGRYSGWRFALPVDWLYTLFFCVGVFQLIRTVCFSLGFQVPNPVVIGQLLESRWRAFAVFGFAMIGLLPIGVGWLPDQLTAWQAGAETIQGRALYPRWFERGKGLTSANPWVVNEIRDFNRLSFVLINQQNADVILPLDVPPAFVPHGADCTVEGTWQAEGWFLARKLTCGPDFMISTESKIQ